MFMSLKISIACLTLLAVNPEAAMPESIPIEEEKVVKVQGRILDPWGNPLEGVSIEDAFTEIYTDRIPKDIAWKNTGLRTKKDGRFSMAVPLHRLPLSYLRFRHPEHFDAKAAMIKALPVLDGTFHAGDIRLNQAFFIRGRVLRRGGVPASACSVTLLDNFLFEGADEAPMTSTDESGRFFLKVGRARSARIQVAAYKGDTDVGWSPEVLPGRDQQIPEVEIILRESRPISGRILNADGASESEQLVFAEGRIAGHSFSREALTDSQGKFRFTLLPDVLYEIKVQHLNTSTEAPDRDPTRLILARGVSPGTQKILYHLPPGSEVVIRLEDAEKNPILPAPQIDLVTVAETGPGSSFSLSFPWTGKVVNPGPGIFGFSDVPGGDYDILVRVEGFGAHKFMNVTVPPPGGKVDLTAVLEKEPGIDGSITGKVCFADGSPAGGVAVLKEFNEVEKKSPFRISAFPRRDGKSERKISFTGEGIRTRSGRVNGGRHQLTVIVTDEEGRFSFEGMEMGEHDLYLRVEGWEVFKKAPISVTEEHPKVALEITLPSLDGSIEGMVRDRRDRPLAGACVVAWDGDKLFNITCSDASGRYAFTGLPDGRYVVDAQVLCYSAEGSLESSIRVNVIQEESLETLDAYNAVIEKGSAFPLDLIVKDPWNGVLDVRILTAESRPLPEAMRIEITELEQGSRRKRKNYSTADLFTFNTLTFDALKKGPGHYQYRNLRAGRYQLEVYLLDLTNRIKHPGGHFEIQHWSLLETLSLDPSAMKKLTVHLPLATIQGTVLDQATGDPVPGAKMLILPASDKEKTYFYGSLDAFEFAAGLNGSFLVKDIPAGTFNLIILQEGYFPFVKADLQLRDNSDRLGLRFALKKGGCTVSGRLKIPDNKNGIKLPRGITSVHIALTAGSPWWISPKIPPVGACRSLGAAVGEDGSFTLKDLPSGPVKLVVFQYGMEVFEKTVDLPLPEGEVLVIEVR